VLTPIGVMRPSGSGPVVRLFAVSLESAVPALAARDAKRLLRFVAEAESIGGDQPFTTDLMVELGRLVPADDFVGYEELDLVRRRALSPSSGTAKKWTPTPTGTMSSGTSWSRRTRSVGGAGKGASERSSSRISCHAESSTVRASTISVCGRRRRVRALRSNSLTAMAHEVLRVQSHGEPGLHRARPARTRPPPAASGAALAGGKDTSATELGARGARSC
jgi:hypothetical protein